MIDRFTKQPFFKTLRKNSGCTKYRQREAFKRSGHIHKQERHKKTILNYEESVYVQKICINLHLWLHKLCGNY